MSARGLLPEFSPTVLAEVEGLRGPAQAADDPSVRDLRGLLWASIDNDDSRDLDQLSWAERAAGDAIRVLVAVADVDALVRDGSAIDAHARVNTTSVYTAARIFSMLPERLSTDLTSLNDDEDRLAMIVEMTVGRDGAVRSSDVYRGWVRNRAKLAYNGVAAWLDGHAPAPAPVAAVPDLDDALRLQDEAAQSLRALRHVHGALTLETVEARPVFDGEKVSGLEVQERNRAKDIIEDFMVAANGVTARYLADRNLPSIRRVVRTPKRWDRIVALAAERGVALPAEPDSKALDAFLVRAKAADPQRFPDLSLTIIKLMGAGEYTAELPGATVAGHFGLAVKDYAHSTAPNRRYADLITQRLLKAALAGRPSPYNGDALVAIAEHLTAAEDAANRVERQVGKSAAALLLDDKIGQRFEAFVTGASDKGTWVRLIELPVEGRVEKGAKGLDVGDRTRVRLLSVDVDRGFIDFENVGGGGG